MVFKTTCVGSIPAILVIVNFSRLTIKTHTVKPFGTNTVVTASLGNVLLSKKNNVAATNQRKVSQNFHYRTSVNLHQDNREESVSVLSPDQISGARAQLRVNSHSHHTAYSTPSNGKHESQDVTKNLTTQNALEGEQYAQLKPRT